MPRDIGLGSFQNYSELQSFIAINAKSAQQYVRSGGFFFGGVVLRDFALAMILGVMVGTYSSVFVASPIVFAWRKETKRVTVKREKVVELAAQQQKREDKKAAPKPKPKTKPKKGGKK